MTAAILTLFEIENPRGGELEKPVEPLGRRFGQGAEGPGKPYMVRIKLREDILSSI
jgi:hypothetical protein